MKEHAEVSHKHLNLFLKNNFNFFCAKTVDQA